MSMSCSVRPASGRGVRHCATSFGWYGSLMSMTCIAPVPSFVRYTCVPYFSCW